MAVVSERPNYVISIEYITKELADFYLLSNLNNRNIKSKQLNKYIHDMESGNWQNNGGSIAFYEDGTLKDGQHRLMAISKSGVGQWMIVIRNIPINAVIGDTGAKRSVADIMKLDGAETALRDTTTISICRLLNYIEYRSDFITDSDCMDMLKFYAENFTATYELALAGHKNLTRSRHFGTAIFVALNAGIPVNTIDEFCSIVRTGFCNDASKYAAIVLRNHLIASSNQVMPLSGADKMYFFIMMSLDDFINGKPRQRNYTALKEPKWAETARKNIISNWEKNKNKGDK